MVSDHWIFIVQRACERRHNLGGIGLRRACERRCGARAHFPIGVHERVSEELRGALISQLRERLCGCLADALIFI
jgi:hypothetical protein